MICAIRKITFQMHLIIFSLPVIFAIGLFFYISHARDANLIQLTARVTDSCHVDKCQCHNTTQPFPDTQQLSEFTLALIAVILRSRASGHDIRLNLGTARLFVTVNCLANRMFICFANSVLLGGHFFSQAVIGSQS